MPKINKYKILNLKYGDKGLRLLSDKTLELNGDHLQVEATNSSGKSITLQTLIQAICPLSDGHKKFVDIYNVKEPVYSVIEWILDDEETKLITGVGFEKKNIINTEEKTNNTKFNLYNYFTFTIEESFDMNIDIDNLAFYEQKNNNKFLKSIKSMENYIKDLKNKFPGKVSLFGQYNQIKYKDKLSEYGIFQSEWKEIILKLNSDEAILSKFFNDFNTTEKFVKNQLLPLIDSTLNKAYSNNIEPIKRIREQTIKFVNYCIQFEGEIQKHKNYSSILKCCSDLKGILDELNNIEDNIILSKNSLSEIYYFSENEIKILENKISNLDETLKNLFLQQNELDYEKESFDYNNSKLQIKNINKELEIIENNINLTNQKIQKEKDFINILKYQDLNEKLQEELKTIAKKQSIKDSLMLDYKEISKKIQNISYTIHKLSLKDKNDLEVKICDLETKVNNLKCKLNNLENCIEKDFNTLRNQENKKIELQVSLQNYNKKLEKFCDENKDIRGYLKTDLLGQSVDFDDYINFLENDLNKTENLIKTKKENIKNTYFDIDNLTKEKFELNLQIKDFKSSLKECGLYLEKVKNFNFKLNSFCNKYELKNQKFDDFYEVEKEINKIIFNVESKINNLIETKINKNNELKNYKNSSNLILEKEIVDFLNDYNIDIQFGFNYLMDMKSSFDFKVNFVKKIPFFPYSIIISDKDFKKIKEIDKNFYTKIVTPIIIRESLNELLDFSFDSFKNIVSEKNLHLFLSFDYSLLDEKKRKENILNLENEIENINKQDLYLKKELENLKNIIFDAKNINYTKNKENELEKEIKNIQQYIIDFNLKIKETENNIKNLNVNIKENEDIINNSEKQVNKFQIKINEINSLKYDYLLIQNNQKEINVLTENINSLQLKIEKNQQEIDSISEDINLFNAGLRNLYDKKKINSKFIEKYSSYNVGEIIEGSVEVLEERLNELKQDFTTREISELDEDISKCISRKNNILDEMNELKNLIDKDDILDIKIIYSKKVLKENLNIFNKELKSLENNKYEKLENLNQKTGVLEYKFKIIKEKYLKDPIELDKIIDFDFEKRKKEIYTNKENCEKSKKQTLNDKSKLENLIKDLKSFKNPDLNLVNTNLSLEKAYKNKETLLKNLSDFYKNKDLTSKKLFLVYKDLNNFNFNTEKQYENILNNLMGMPYDDINKNNIISQINMINRVKLILNEKIDMLDNFNKHFTKEKEIIIYEIKNYLKDCILELKVFNKLGRFNESKLFNIDLPDEDKLNYLVVDEIVENLSINKDLDEVNSVINSFYLLNKLINISNLKIKVIKFELNNKKSFINWNEISKYTSGGQQFCVSFIILVILMEYKRYDPKKLSNKPVSKVLIMDNPFGKTSEEEFLNLVFKLADKFKVQIISYTHITNASVRNQFNKIYKMTVELTTNNREIVIFEESRNNSIKENVEMNNYFIEKENAKDINFFGIIK